MLTIIKKIFWKFREVSSRGHANKKNSIGIGASKVTTESHL